MDGLQAIVALVLAKVMNDIGVLGVVSGVLIGIVADKRYPEFGTRVNAAVADTFTAVHAALSSPQPADGNGD